jgi:hypothetical protein
MKQIHFILMSCLLDDAFAKVLLKVNGVCTLKHRKRGQTRLALVFIIPR